MAASSTATPASAATSDAPRMPTLASSVRSSDSGNDKPGDEQADREADAGHGPDAEHDRPPGVLRAAGRPGAAPPASRPAARRRACRPPVRGRSPAPPVRRSASSTTPPPRSTPALARANTGRATYADNGWREDCSRSTTGTDSPRRNRSRDSSSGSRRAVAQRLLGVAARDVLVEQRLGGREQRDRDAGQRRVDAGLEDREPHHDPDHDVGPDRPDAQPPHHHHQRQQRHRRRRATARSRSAV